MILILLSAQLIALREFPRHTNSGGGGDEGLGRVKDPEFTAPSPREVRAALRENSEGQQGMPLKIRQNTDQAQVCEETSWGQEKGPSKLLEEPVPEALPGLDIASVSSSQIRKCKMSGA